MSFEPPKSVLGISSPFGELQNPSKCWENAKKKTHLQEFAQVLLSEFTSLGCGNQWKQPATATIGLGLAIFFGREDSHPLRTWSPNVWNGQFHPGMLKTRQDSARNRYDCFGLPKYPGFRFYIPVCGQSQMFFLSHLNF